MRSICTNAAQPHHTVPKGQTFAGGLGPLACGHCSAGSPLEGPGGGGRGQADASPPMSFPPPWVFLDYQDFRAQDLRLLLFPHLGNTVTGYTPKQQATGLHQGMMRLGKEWWPEQRMVLKNVEVSYTGKRKENLLPCLSHPPKDWATVESLGGKWNFSEKWGVGSTLSGLSQPAARHVLSTVPTRWCYLSWCGGGGRGVDTGWGRKNPSPQACK